MQPLKRRQRDSLVDLSNQGPVAPTKRARTDGQTNPGFFSSLTAALPSAMKNLWGGSESAKLKKSKSASSEASEMRQVGRGPIPSTSQLPSSSARWPPRPPSLAPLLIPNQASGIRHHESFFSPQSRPVQPRVAPAKLAEPPRRKAALGDKLALTEEQRDQLAFERRQARKWDKANSLAAGTYRPSAHATAASDAEPSYKKKRPMGVEQHQSEVRKRDERRLNGFATVAVQNGLANRPENSQDLEQYAAMVYKLAGDTFQPAASYLKGARAKKAQTTSRQQTGSSLDNVLRNARQTLATPAPPVPDTFNFDRFRETIEDEDREAEELRAAPRQKRRIFPRSLSPEDQRLVKSLQHTGPMDTVISQMTGAEVCRKDILKLDGLQWLNDETITFYAMLINKRSKELDGTSPRIKDGIEYKNAYAFSHQMYRKLALPPSDMGGFAGVKRWTRKVDLFSYDIVIFPINLNNQHWVCAAINMKRKRFEYYDSLGGPSKVVYRTLRSYITAEHLDKKKKPLDLSDWEDYWNDDVPRQQNGCDCGVFTCQFMESLSRTDDGFDFEQEQMPYFRQKMVLEMKRQELVVEPFA